jgi:hypothetical protein
MRLPRTTILHANEVLPSFVREEDELLLETLTGAELVEMVGGCADAED